MITKKYIKLFRTALLNKAEDRIAELEEKILKSGASVEEIESEKRWAETAYPYVKEALELREQGFFVESLKFDELETRANEIGFPLPAFLRNLMQSSVMIELESAQKSKTHSKPYTKYDSINRTIDFLLSEIRWKASWGNKGSSDVKALLKEIQERFPDSVDQAQQNIDIGREIFQAINEARQLGLAGKDESALEKLYEKLINKIGEDISDYQRTKIREQYDSGVASRERDLMNSSTSALSKIEAEEFIMDSDESASNRSLEHSNIHPNFISMLPPSKKWTILIDETGTDFSSKAQETDNLNRGRIVGVVVPMDYCKLPVLPADYHSVKESYAIIQDTVTRITQSPCGVLGISLNGLHSLKGDLWYVGIETLLDTILRLLPIDGETEVTVHVEQRSLFTPEMSVYLESTCASCVNRLFRTYPNRAKQITISGKFVKKIESPLIGYADTVAFCWGGSSVSKILENSGWENTCLFDSDPEQLCKAIDSLQRQDSLDEREWDDLISRRESDKPNSLANALLKIQGQEAAADQTLWNEYLEHVQKHLNSKAIDMRKLGKQIAWLKSYMPDEATLSPRMRLLWLTTQLAQANHLGQIDMIAQYQKEFERLCTLLYPEDAPLTCWTSLHVAVAYMNDFNFKTAYNVVKDWIGIDEAVPGRVYYGQVLSTVGQLNAFIGNQDAAVDAFNLALDKFEKLTNADEMARNVNQTSSYKVVAMMDSNPVPDNMAAEMEKYLGRTLEEAADQFAVSDDPGEKYMHHIFLRYLVHVNSPELKPIIEKYLSHKSKWKTAYGHPWEMIDFYRALLQKGSGAKFAYLEKAYNQVAKTNDGTLKVIACTILGGLYCYDPTRKEELAKLTQKVIDSMPYLGEARVTALKNQVESPVDPLTLAKAVLPFNFR